MTTNFMTITIDGIDISKYSEYYVLNHITKKTEPKRSDAFTMTNINEIEQVEIPEIFIKFKYIKIDLYRQIIQATRKTEFAVTYYDQDYDMIRTNMFYLKDKTSLNPHAWGGRYYGFKEFELNLVCTMNPVSTLSIGLYNESNVEYKLPYLIDCGKISDANKSVYVSTKLNDSFIANEIEVTFSNDSLKLSGTNVVKEEESNVYKVKTNNSTQTLININISNLKFTGEYVMFLSVKDSNYGNSTVSCVLKVGN